MATSPSYTTQPSDQYPLGATYAEDSKGDVAVEKTYDTEGVVGNLGEAPFTQDRASVKETDIDGSGGASGMEPTFSGYGIADVPTVSAVQLDTNAYGLGTLSDGLMKNPSVGAGGGDDYLVSGNNPGTADSYVPPTYDQGAITGTLDTQSGGGSPIQQANPAYRAPSLYPSASELDTSGTLSPVSSKTDEAYGDETQDWISGTFDTENPKYPMQTTSTNTPATPGSAPVATGVNSGATITFIPLADPAGAKIHGYRIEAVHLKTGESTGANTALSSAGVIFAGRGVNSETTASGVSAPTGLAAAAATTGGSFTAGTYRWVVTATNADGESVASNEVSATVSANQEVPLSWNAVAGATGYKVYRGTTAGGENVRVGTVTGTTFTDTGAAGTAATPPATNTSSRLSVFYADLVPGDSYAFRYAGVNDNGTGAYSGWSNVVVPLNYLEVPTGSLDPANLANPIYLPDGTVKPGTGGTTGPVRGAVIAEPVTGQPTELGITWSAPTWGTPTGYTLNTYQVSPEYGPGTLRPQDLVKSQTTGASPTFPVVVTGLVAGTQYVVEVIPFTAVGNGVAVFSEVVTTQGPTEPEKIPSGEGDQEDVV